MGAIANGLALHGGIRPYVATFLVFSDYMRRRVRLAALMAQPVVFVFTHDSIFVGEDGPTHQPVEQLAALRAIPNLDVWRPADARETVAAWDAALRREDGPTALLLSRQNLPVLERTASRKPRAAAAASSQREAAGTAELVIAATGSELSTALEAARALAAEGRRVRVVSLPCLERFAAQDAAYHESVLPAAGRGWSSRRASRRLAPLVRPGDRLA